MGNIILLRNRSKVPFSDFINKPDFSRTSFEYFIFFACVKSIFQLSRARPILNCFKIFSNANESTIISDMTKLFLTNLSTRLSEQK